MTDEIELKPCPLCGGKAELETDAEAEGDGCWSYVYCMQCYATVFGDGYDGAEKAIGAWNERTVEPWRPI